MQPVHAWAALGQAEAVDALRILSETSAACACVAAAGAGAPQLLAVASIA